MIQILFLIRKHVIAGECLSVQHGRKHAHEYACIMWSERIKLESAENSAHYETTEVRASLINGSERWSAVAGR